MICMYCGDLDFDGINEILNLEGATDDVTLTTGTIEPSSANDIANNRMLIQKQRLQQRQR